MRAAIRVLDNPIAQTSCLDLYAQELPTVVGNQVVTLVLAERDRDHIAGFRERGDYANLGDIAFSFRIAFWRTSDGRTSWVREPLTILLWKELR
jgi:hypothetical protein